MNSTSWSCSQAWFEMIQKASCFCTKSHMISALLYYFTVDCGVSPALAAGVEMCWWSVHVSCTAEHQSKVLLAQSALHLFVCETSFITEGLRAFSVWCERESTEKARILLFVVLSKYIAIKFRPETTFSGRLLSHETESHKKWKQIWGYNWKEVASLWLRAPCVDQQMALDSFILFCALVFCSLTGDVSMESSCVPQQATSEGGKHYITRSCIRAHTLLRKMVLNSTRKGFFGL